MDFSTIMEQVQSFIIAYGFKIIGAILTLIIGFWVIGWITRVVNNTMEKRGFDATIRPFLGSLVSVGMKILLLLSVASMFGIETTSFIAIFSALAFAIGLALQGSLGHFASGVMLLVFKPYKVGDLVNIGGGQNGTVEGIQVFNTVLKTLDNKRIFVPNGVVTGNVITNISGQGILGVELTFGIGYGDSIDKAREAILKVGKECPWVLDDPAQGVFVASWGDSSVNLASRPFCNSENYWPTYFYMHEHVKKEFDRVGISIPFPQMDVHLDK
ncbi:MAG: mechanosensitive ion channel [Phaeodactylibacter sp.]|nr:mechanosensitive ion channel [Phaeodactylibacter sp.]